MKKATKLTKSCLQIGSCPLNDRYAPNDLAIPFSQTALIDRHALLFLGSSTYFSERSVVG